MTYNPAVHHRRSIRLQEYDYAQAGAYFVTICTYNHQSIFGKIGLDHIGQTVGVGLAPAPNGKGQPAPAQNGKGQPASAQNGKGQPRGLPLLNEFGQIALEQWHKLSDRFPTIELDAFVVMPNHIHGIIFITKNGQPTGTSQGGGVGSATLGEIVGAYKSLVSNECLKIYRSRNETMGKLWQRNYYEHIIRDEKSFENIVYYIENNSSTWQQDELFRGEKL